MRSSSGSTNASESIATAAAEDTRRRPPGRLRGARAARAGAIMPYRLARKLTAGKAGATQAHHILEARHLRSWGLSEAEGPAIVLRRAEHQQITNELQGLLPTGQAYSVNEVMEAYNIAYRGHPGWLRAVRRYLRAHRAQIPAQYR
jgi:hypothetical protein